MSHVASRQAQGRVPTEDTTPSSKYLPPKALRSPFPLLFVEVDKDKLTFMFEMEGQTCPVIKPDRIGRIAVFGDP
jgi:hypothetical protein